MEPPTPWLLLGRGDNHQDQKQEPESLIINYDNHFSLLIVRVGDGPSVPPSQFYMGNDFLITIRR